MSEPCSQALFPYGVVTIWRNLSCLRLWLDRWTMNVRLKNFVLTDIDWWTILRLQFGRLSLFFFRDLNHDLLLERPPPHTPNAKSYSTGPKEPLKQFRPAVYKNLTQSNIFPNNRLGLPEDGLLYFRRRREKPRGVSVSAVIRRIKLDMAKVSF
jgi:hypothetical protein